jgi:hypothetical protein
VPFGRGAQIGVNDGNMKADRVVCVLGIELLQFGPNSADVFEGRRHDDILAGFRQIAVAT